MYHFENKENDQYFHDITFDKNMLEQEKSDDIVSHLYMAEGYYFNPKVLKRHQVSTTFSAILHNFVFTDFKQHFNFILFQILIGDTIGWQTQEPNEFLRRRQISRKTQHSWKLTFANQT